jgi:cytochrome c oxidase assembly protein subunit 11
VTVAAAPGEPLAARNRRVAFRAVLFVLFMVGLAFASVPLYRIFCQVTGFGGTPMRADAAPGRVAGAAPVSIRFDANVNPALPWRFQPESNRIEVALGEKNVVNYTARNLVARPTSGTASFNVSPASAGQYFSKIQCFCFSKQTLKPGEEVKMPVIFFVDPKIKEDPATRDIREITLSYTFYPMEKPGQSS